MTTSLSARFAEGTRAASSKVAAWTTIDRWLKPIDLLELAEDTAPWEALREQIRNDVLTNGFNTT